MEMNKKQAMEREMPLIKGAKPGSSGFKKNIEAEVAAGKPVKQAVAIAYSESGEHKKKGSKGIKSRHKGHSDSY